MNKFKIKYLIVLIFTSGCVVNKYQYNDTKLIGKLMVNDSAIISILNPTFQKYKPYHIQILTKDTSNITLESESDVVKIMKDSTNSYTVNFYGSDYLYLYKNNDNNKVELYKKRIDPNELILTPMFNRKYQNGSPFTETEFRNGILTVEAINQDINLVYMVKSFTMSFTINDSLVVTHNNGCTLSEEQYAYIQGLKNRQPLLFSNLEIEIDNVTSKILNDILVCFIVKNN
jgi:hypothetical protein